MSSYIKHTVQGIAAHSVGVYDMDVVDAGVCSMDVLSVRLHGMEVPVVSINKNIIS